MSSVVEELGEKAQSWKVREKSSPKEEMVRMVKSSREVLKTNPQNPLDLAIGTWVTFTSAVGTDWGRLKC